MIEVKEITVASAFAFPKVSFKEKSLTCVACKNKIESIIAVNREFGLCSICGDKLFDWRPLDKKSVPLTDDEKKAIKKAHSLQILLSQIKIHDGIPLHLAKNIQTIDETIEALKLIKKMKQGKTISSLGGLTNKIKFYLLGYVFEEDTFRREVSKND